MTQQEHLEQRLVEVETRLAYQEHSLQTLDDVITRQQKRIDQLEALCRQLAERVRSGAEPSAINTLAEERPPHY